MQLAGRFGPATTLLGTCQAVDENEMTCVLLTDLLEMPDVRLKPILNEDEGITIFPALGSWCLAVRLEGSEDWVLIASNKVNKWRLKVGEAVIEQSLSGLEISNAGANLKDILTKMIEAVMQIVVVMGSNPNYAKLTEALTKINLLLK